MSVQKFAPIGVMLLSLLSYSSQTSVVTFNCNKDSNPAADFKVSTVEKGAQVLVCVHFLPVLVKMSFYVEVDKYTLITGKRIFDVLQTKDTDIVVQFTGSEQFSDQLPYNRKVTSKVYPIIALLVTTDMGVIKTIKMEDITAGCPDNKEKPDVLPLTDYIFYKELGSEICGMERCQDTKDGFCDFKIFIAWTGTDSKGNTMISTAERILNFEKYNLPAMYSSITIMDNNVGDASKDELDYNAIPETVRKTLEDI